MNHILRKLSILLCLIFCGLHDMQVCAGNTATVKSDVTITSGIDTSKAVGEIPITSGTDPYGAKTYQVPISIPPGINGFQPNLSLNYSSMHGFSTIGSGWALGGVPQITRGGKNIYFDGETEGVVMDNSDSFVIDGMRLIKIQTEASYILYETEQGNIKANGYVDGNSMRYFEVFYPDGNRGLFGAPDWSGNRITYPVHSLTDPRGNIISFEYLRENNYDYIKKITYNGVTVQFTYTSHSCAEIYYRYGIKTECKKAIDHIYVSDNGTSVGYYTLFHTYSNNTVLLDKISYSCGTGSLNPLTFFYGKGDSTDKYTLTDIEFKDGYKMDDLDNRVDLRAVRGKFNYRSNADALLTFPDKSPYSLMSGNKGIDNLYKGTETIYQYFDLSEEQAHSNSGMTTGSGFIDVMCADIEGRQEENVIRINNYPHNNTDRIDFNVYKTNGSSGLKLSYTRSFAFSTLLYTSHLSVQPKFYYPGDFDGDGRMEILAVSVHQPLGGSLESQCYIFDIESGEILHQSHLFPFRMDFSSSSYSELKESENNSDKVFVIDYDGDGKSDLCHVGEDGMTVYTFRTTATGLVAERIAVNNSIKRSSLSDRYFLPGDINGDGLTDFVLSPLRVTPYGSTWMLYYSKGDGTFDKVESKSGPLISTNQVPSFILHDINGDGKSDLIGKLRDKLTTYLISGNTFYQKATTKVASHLSVIVPADHNSRNEHAQLMSVFNGKITLHSFLRDLRQDALLTMMSNSLGVVERNEYGYIDDTGVQKGYYIRGSGAVYPYINIIEPLAVLTSMETSLVDRILSSRDFQYENAVFHRHGRGFCGFEKVIATDEYGRTYTQESEPYRFALPKRSVTPTTDTRYTYTAEVAPDKTLKVLLTKMEESDLLKGTSAVTTYIYDAYGYPVEENTVASDNISVKTVCEYSNNAGIDDAENGYMLGMPLSRATTRSRGSSVYTALEQIPAYSRGLPTGRKTYVDGNLVEETEYVYDSYGNLVKESARPYDSTTALDKTYSYDSNGHLLKETDAMGLVTQYTYNTRGLVSASTDCRGNVTSYEYDPFGRQTKRCNPDGTVETVAYAWETTDNGGLYSRTVTATGKPDVRTCFDPLNREVRSEQKRFDGTTMKTDREYDSKGNLTLESMPYKSGSPSSWTTYSYDSYDRLTCRTEPTGKRTSYTYDGTSVTEDDGTKVKTRGYDSDGNLVSVSDTEGTIVFSLHADGQQESVRIDDGSQSDGLTTTFGYDKYRRRISVNDPSQGETLTAYDEAGDIASQTDANGVTTTFEYDSFGRLVKKSFPEFETTYGYSAYNEQVSQVSTNGTYRYCTYDDLGRLVSEKDGCGVEWLRKDYTYTDGNVGTISYTSKHGGLTTEYHTYTNGHLSEVRMTDGKLIYRLEEESSLGKPTRAVTGDITRYYEYDDYGFPAGRKAESGGKVYQDEYYSFDILTSNLDYRDDCISDTWEFFEYDTQDRLVRANGESVSYHPNGNIADRSDVGYYIYRTPGKPYAVSGVMPFDDPDASLYNGQDIEYTSFCRPSGISENGTTASFTYNADGDRVRMYMTKGDADCLDRIYLGGCYECDRTGMVANNYIEKLYLMGDFYSAPSVLVSGPMAFVNAGSGSEMKGDSLIWGLIDPVDPIRPVNPLGIDDSTVAPRHDYFSSGKRKAAGLHQILRDYLGSITHVIQPDGTEVETLSYDAWGRVRLPEEYGRYLKPSDPPLYLGRGYTGHEHLPLFGLVNMNARLYDPWLGRFLSPDPYIAFTDWLQSYNRYTYALNNPLCYIDQDGEFPWIIVWAVVGGAINVCQNWDIIKEKGFWTGVGYFGVGALSTVITPFAGGFVAGKLIPRAMSGLVRTGFLGAFTTEFAEGFAGAFTLEFGNSLLEGKNIGHSLLDGLEAGAMFGAIAGTTSGIKGGIKASKSGRNFWSGKLSNESIIERSAEKWNKNIPGKGHVAGTKKHSKTFKMINRYQNMYEDRGLITEPKQEYLGRKYIPDIVDMKNRIIYDLKFGYPNLTPYDLNNTTQMFKYRNLWEMDSKIIQIK